MNSLLSDFKFAGFYKLKFGLQFVWHAFIAQALGVTYIKKYLAQSETLAITFKFIFCNVQQKIPKSVSTYCLKFD